MPSLAGEANRSTPKTLNEYLNSANAFLNWLVRQNRLPKNPLSKVTKVDIRGRQKKRRALSVEELARLITVAGERRLIYPTAVYGLESFRNYSGAIFI